MKYRLTFMCENPVELPKEYNKILQAALLNWLGDNRYSEFLHDQGYQNEKRSFKLYTFSEIIGENRFNSRNKRIQFFEKIQIYISFYTDESHELILKNIEAKKQLILGSKKLELYDCELVRETYSSCMVETLSPITIHSTLELPDGRKKTYYYEPTEKDFSEMLKQNLKRKYVAFYGEVPENDEFVILPIGKRKEVVCRYNRFIIKGWKGKFRIQGSEEMIRMALLSGIGARNGIGFGCVIQTEVL